MCNSINRSININIHWFKPKSNALSTLESNRQNLLPPLNATTNLNRSESTIIATNRSSQSRISYHSDISANSGDSSQSTTSNTSRNFDYSLEDIISYCGLGKFQWFVMILACSVWFSAAIQLMCTSILILNLKQTSSTLINYEAGIIASVPFLGEIFGAFLLSMFSHKYGRKKAILVASLSLSFFGGCAVGGSLTTLSLVTEFIPQKHSGKRIDNGELVWDKINNLGQIVVYNGDLVMVLMLLMVENLGNRIINGDLVWNKIKIFRQKVVCNGDLVMVLLLFMVECLESPKQYTTSLTSEQIEQYHNDGYIVARNVIPVSYIEALRIEALAYAEKYRGSLYHWDKYSGRNAIHRPSLHANWAYHLVQNLGNIGQLTSNLFDNKAIHLVFDTLDYILPKQKTAYAAPIRKETHGHRDGVRAWIPLEDITRNNSPPIVIPGSHLWCEECFMGHGPCALCFASDLRNTPKCPNNNELLNNIEKWNTKVLDDVKCGDVVFINPKALHSTGEKRWLWMEICCVFLSSCLFEFLLNFSDLI